MKFLVDAMLGRLARFLRIFGYDTVYANDLIDYFKVDPVSDEKLKEYAQKNNRIIITKDYPLSKSFRNKSLYLRGEGVYNYLNQLKNRLGLNFDFKIERARCSNCNSPLKKIKDKSLIKDNVLKDTFNHYDEYFQCSNLDCKKVYWKGTHIEDIENKLEKNFRK